MSTIPKVISNDRVTVKDQTNVFIPYSDNLWNRPALVMNKTGKFALRCKSHLTYQLNPSPSNLESRRSQPKWPALSCCVNRPSLVSGSDTWRPMLFSTSPTKPSRRRASTRSHASTAPSSQKWRSATSTDKKTH
jgi:hypothetical protein